jgi:hypothetical protein
MRGGSVFMSQNERSGTNIRIHKLENKFRDKKISTVLLATLYKNFWTENCNLQLINHNNFEQC